MQTDRQFKPCGPQPFPGVPLYSHPGRLVHRGGQPHGDGLARLAAAGVALVVDLRAEADPREAELKVRMQGMAFRWLPVQDHYPPDAVQVATWLEYARDEEGGPVFVRCHAGRGRTGTMICCWRMAVCGWPLDLALEESQLFRLRILGVPVPFPAVEERQRRFLRAWALTAGFPLGGGDD